MTATQSPRGCLHSSPVDAQCSLALPSIGGQAGVQIRGQWLHWKLALALLSTAFHVAGQPGRSVQLWPWSYFFLSLVGPGGTVCAALPCRWLRLYVPSQVPLSLHTRSKKASVLRRGKRKAMWFHCSVLLSPDIFLNVGQQLCELCAVRVVRPSFVWIPVHSCQVFQLAFFVSAAVSLTSCCRLHVFSHYCLSPSLCLVCHCIFSVSSRRAQHLFRAVIYLFLIILNAAAAVVLSSLLTGCRPSCDSILTLMQFFYQEFHGVSFSSSLCVFQ